MVCGVLLRLGRASAAYLTVSEIFPMETRAMAIAFFYAVGTGVDDGIGPVLFGRFVEQGRGQVAFGYYLGLMIAAGLVELVLGVEAAKRSLEDIATPLHHWRSRGGRPRRQQPRGSPSRQWIPVGPSISDQSM